MLIYPLAWPPYYATSAATGIFSRFPLHFKYCRFTIAAQPYHFTLAWTANTFISLCFMFNLCFYSFHFIHLFISCLHSVRCRPTIHRVEAGPWCPERRRAPRWYDRRASRHCHGIGDGYGGQWVRVIVRFQAMISHPQ